MARAKRHYIPGHIWHITHRCHKREFLLKFAKDRRRWLQWLFEAKKRYGVAILNYNEIQQPRNKNIIIDYERLRKLLGFDSYERLITYHKGWV